MGFAGLHPDRVLGATETEPISAQTDKDAGVFTHQLPIVLGGLLLGGVTPPGPQAQLVHSRGLCTSSGGGAGVEVCLGAVYRCCR